MTEQIEQVTAPPGAVPARIEFEDFIEAVTRGVARALAEQDHVSGYAQAAAGVLPPLGGSIVVGLILDPRHPGVFQALNLRAPLLQGTA